MRSISSKKQRGFSLIEAAIVVTILSITAIGMANLLPVNSIDSKYKSTVAKIDFIENALEAYVKQNGMLPCPAPFDAAPASATFGVMDATCATSSGADNNTNMYRRFANSGNDDVWIGIVPTRTLGIPDSYVYDGFGMRINYAIPRVLASSSANYRAYTNNPINIQDSAANSINGANTVAYVLLSHGNNASGSISYSGSQNACPITGDDAQNCAYIATSGSNVLSRTFRDQPFNTVAANVFDDMIRWKSLSVLNNSAVVNQPIASSIFYEIDSNYAFASTTEKRRFNTAHANNSIDASLVALNTGTYVFTIQPGRYLINITAPLYSSSTTNVTGNICLRDLTNGSVCVATSPDITNATTTTSRIVSMQNLSTIINIASATTYDVIESLSVVDGTILSGDNANVALPKATFSIVKLN